MQNNSSQKIRLGIFVTIGTLLLFIAVVLIGKKQNMFSKSYIINTTFKNVSGLRLGNNVYYSGIKVGTVKNIEIIENSLVLVQMNVNSESAKHITKKDLATINLSGLVGDMAVNIMPNKNSSLPVKSGDTIASYSKTNTENMLSTLNTTNEKVAKLTDNLLHITTRILEGNGTLSLLINDETVAGDLKQTMNQLKQASLSANATLTDLNKNINAKNYDKSVVGVLLSDTLSGNKIKQVILNLETSSKNINTVSDNLNQLVTEMKSDKGAVHYLTQNPALVNDIETSVQSIKEGTEKFNQNMEALKTNFLFKKYFKKLEKSENTQFNNNN